MEALKAVEWRNMEAFEYIVDSIDGDYVHLKRTDQEEAELKLVARALLVPELCEGMRLKYEMFEYSILEGNDS